MDRVLRVEMYLLICHWASNVKSNVLWIVTFLSIVATNTYANEPLECLIEPHRLVAITSSEVGVLASVNVDEADVVFKSDIIAALRTDVESAVLEISRARADANSEIELLRRDHDFTVRNRDRVNELNDKEVVSAQDVDEVRTAQDAAWLRLQAAMERQHTAQLEAARDELALARRTVLSPIDGVVVTRFKSAGEYVDGDPIVQIAQLDPLRVRVVVPIAMYGQIQVGMQATVLPELPIAGPFLASVTRIDPMMDAATATLSVRLSLPNPDNRLPAGLKCTLVLHPMEEKIADTDTQPESEHGLGKNADTALESATSKVLPSADRPPQFSAALEAKPIERTAAAVILIEPSEITDTQIPNPANEPISPNSVTNHKALDSEPCLTVGPLQDTDTDDLVETVLNKSDMKFMRRYASELNVDGLWGVISQQSHEDGQALIKRLEQKDVSDFQWFRRGPWMHHMSYGWYRDRKNAQTRVNHMQSLGLNAQLVTKGSTKSSLWFDLFRTSNDNDSTHGALIKNLRDQYPKISVLPITCPELASR
ncbi:MAG: RND family efflux transporter MFP subunit [Granulosicoccus sp.]|jgi:RND family efflux transporter MFP subunit